MASSESPPKRVIIVKTLDGQNREFVTEEGMTVLAFKAMIEGPVGIRADVQRLIFRGRVLQDEKTLDEYELDGNTVHLVQRPPGSSANPQPPPQPQPDMGEIGGNAFIMGTMGHLDVQQNAAAPRRNSAAVRLQVATEMINRASNLLLRLEEEEVEIPADNSNTASADGNQSPSSGGAATGLMAQIANAASAAALIAVSHVDNNNGPQVVGARGVVQGGQLAGPPPEPPRIRELATSLQDVLALQERLTPFLRLVLNVLRENRQYSSSQAPQFIFNTVTAALHAVSHSLHALSDISIDFSAAPDARRLRAPASILFEQSTVLRATIPVAGMQLPANLQNMVNAAAAQAAAGVGQGQQGGNLFPFMLGGQGQQQPGFMFPPPQQQPQQQPQQTQQPPQQQPPQQQPPQQQPQQTQQPPQQQPRPPQQMQMQFPDFLSGLLGQNEPNRPEIYDILLQCQSHHNNAPRQQRPADINEHLDQSSATRQSENHLELFLQILGSIELFQAPLKDFVTGYLLRGRDPGNEAHVRTWAKVVAKKIVEWVLGAVQGLKPNSDIDLPLTLTMIITDLLTIFVRFVLKSETGPQFRTSAIRLLEVNFRKCLVAVKAAFAEREAGVFVRGFIDATLPASSLALRRDLTHSLIEYQSGLPSTGEFIQTKTAAESVAPVKEPEPLALKPPLPQRVAPQPQPVVRQPEPDIEIEEDELPPSRLVPPFLRAVPSAWLDTIQRDIQAQQNLPSQPPFSHGFRTLFPPK